MAEVNKVAEKMARAGYDPEAILADPDAHPLHKMYAEINIGVRDRGEQWSKCPNCGQPYLLTDEDANATTCSKRCWDDYLAYVTNPDGY